MHFAKPTELWKRTSGARQEHVRRATNVLMDDAWNVMQYTGRAEIRAVFEEVRVELGLVEREVRGRVEAVRRGLLGEKGGEDDGEFEDDTGQDAGVSVEAVG